MSIINNGILLASEAAAVSGYQITRSLRFNSADSAYLSRTPASAGNRKTWTWAGWVKFCRVPSGQNSLFNAKTGSGNANTGIDFDSAGPVRFVIWNGSGVDALLTTSQVFRDFSAYYHFVVAVDTTQATSSNRVKIYVNGLQVTNFSSSTYPSQNYDTAVNLAQEHNIGRNVGTAAGHLDGYLADIHFIDGQALDPTSFGEFSATTGVWVPIEYTGTYGTNGFRLPLSDNSATTSTTLGKDSAGSNNWTPNNFSVASGSGNDSLVDVPTNGAQTDTGVGGEVRGNYCTLNPLKYGGDIQAPTNGNLDVTSVGSANGKILGTIGVSSGKWYWECVPNSSDNIAFGITKDNTVLANYPGQDAVDYSYHNDGSKYSNNSGSAYGATFTTNDVIGVAFDADNGTLTFYKNNSTQGLAYSGLTSGPYFPMVGDPSSAPDISATVNFGQRAFAYTAPSGFKALNTANLPAPLVTKPSDLFDVKLYTGNGSTQTISGLGFSPDLVWIKNRAAADSHKLTDTVRGATEELESDTTAAEATNADGLTQFNSDGFDLGDDDEYNTSAEAYVAWAWDAGSSTVTNTDGSISSQVRANASAGFSIVTYSGTLAADTVGHGLGVAPGMIIFKQRGSSIQDWRVYHSSVGAGKSARLNTTAAFATQTTDFTAVSSTTFTLGVSSATNEGSMIAYCFAPVAGYSSFGSYTGNGSADGPFVYTGFRPRWVMFKRTDSVSSGDWVIYDSARDPYNVCQNYLLPNSSGAEAAFANVDYLSNGFKLKSTGSINTSGGTWIYAAFAEHPFNFSRAR
jgi:hypothetical protein